jgi:hypothetical protein
MESRRHEVISAQRELHTEELAIASVAMEGGFSDEQLSSVVQLADGESDREWARRGPTSLPCAPRTIDCSFHTGCSPWSATRIRRTDSNWSPHRGRRREFRCDAVQVNRLPTTR